MPICHNCYEEIDANAIEERFCSDHCRQEWYWEYDTDWDRDYDSIVPDEE